MTRLKIGWRQFAAAGAPVCLVLAVTLIVYGKIAVRLKESFDLGDIFFEGFQFLLVFLLALFATRRWRDNRTLALGILLFLLGSFSDLLDEFLEMPRWVTTYTEGGLLACGAVLAAIGGWFWIKEGERFKEAQQRSEDTQKLLKELSQDITTLDLDSILKKLTDKVREFFKVDISDVRLIEGGVRRVIGVSGVEAERLRLGSTGRGQGGSGWVAEHRSPLVISDISKERDVPTGKTTRAIGIRGYLAVPFFSRGGEVMGILRALTYRPREFAQAEVDLLQRLANDAAIAIENAKLLRQLSVKSQELESTNRRLQRLLQEQNALREIFSQINLLDLGHLLRQLTERALDLLPVDHVQVRLVDASGALQTMTLAGAGAERFRNQMGRSGTSRSTWVMENRRPLTIKDISQDKVYGPGRLMKEMGVKGYICVPLIARTQKSIGVLQATSLKEREFTQEEIALAQQFAAGAAVAIENARLFEELQKKSVELEEAYKTKSAFLNTMAHELRTPLNVLIATMQLFAEGFYDKLTEKQMRGLEPMQRNAVNLLNLIASILDLARLEAKRVPLQVEEFRLKEITDELESFFVPLAKEKGVEMRFRIDEPGLTLTNDKTKIRAVLQNLVGNAVKYTDRGEIELRISAPVAPDDARGDAGRLCIEVRDTGIGIKEADLPHIFDAFYMAEGVNRRKYPGSGLGLCIVKRLLELLGGDIQVRSEWGKSSTFTVTLPLIPPGPP